MEMEVGMAFINPFIKTNQGGIPRLEATVTKSGNDIIYDFQPHRFLNYPYAGYITFKLPSTTAPTSAGDVYFTTGGANKIQVMDYSGAEVSSTDTGLVAGGVFIGWYSDNVIRLLTGLA